MILFSAVLLAPLLLAAQERPAISPAAAQQKFDRVFRCLYNIYVDGVDRFLDKLAGDQVDLFVNGLCVARGDVVVIDDNFGVRITEVLKRPELSELTQTE